MKSEGNRSTGLRWWMLIAMLGLTSLVASRFANMKQLIGGLRQGRLSLIIIALAFHLVYFMLYAGLYQVGFRTVGVKVRMWDLVPLVFVSLFVNALLPSGGAGGAAIFIDDAIQRGQSGARAAVGVVWVLIADLTSLVPFLMFGDVFLHQHQALKFYDVLGTGIFLFFISGLSFLFVLAYWRANLLQAVLSFVRWLFNHVMQWLKRPNSLEEGWPRQTAQDLAQAVNTVLSARRWMATSLAVGFFLHAFNLVGLYILFLAFQQPVRLGTLVAGFGIGIVFFIITIVPQGVGAVLGVMTLVFNSMGIPRTSALVISLAFRGMNFWVPLVCGFFLIRSLNRFKSSGEQAQSG
jgi:glycosyltransferase 2 family protein